MGRPYFRQIPSFQYISRKTGEQNLSDYIPVKNFFKRGKIRDDIFENLAYFTKYSIKGDDRPDNVAFKVYGDESLDWVILLCNNILNIQSEWPMTQRTFERVMLEKYGSYENLYSGIHHYETINIKNSLGLDVIKGGVRVSPTWKTNGNFIEATTSKIDKIYSGDGVNSSEEITVELKSAILNLKKGNQIAINNVPVSAYNGYKIVSEILEFDSDIGVSKFKYKLSDIPTIASPTLSDSEKEEVLFVISDNSTSSGSSYYYEYWDSGRETTVQIPSSSFVKAITNYEYETNIENEKRNIYIIKSEYLNIIFNDMDGIMTYKNGGVQYVNATMKRGDNIRLYE